MNRKDIQISLNKIENEINQGHYLDRMIVIAREFGLTKHVNVLLAFKEILMGSHKPEGLDGFLWETSESIIYIFQRGKFPKKDMWQVVYCLDYDSLNSYLGAKLFGQLREQALMKHEPRNDKVPLN